MSTRPIVYNTKEMQQILEGNGFKLSRQSGDHFIYTDGNRTVSINYRINKMVALRLIKENNLDTSVLKRVKKIQNKGG
ncbi:MAG: hypothetical protein K1W15_07620 [Lachnospiraceae bacterium]|jgi:Predicted periplasmic or secreted lipoprotein